MQYISRNCYAMTTYSIMFRILHKSIRR